MAKASELLQQAADYRDLARRAARLATTVGDADRVRLLRYGRELEEQAAELEKQAAASASPVTLSVGLETPPTTPDQPANDPVDPEQKAKH